MNNVCNDGYLPWLSAATEGACQEPMWPNVITEDCQGGKVNRINNRINAESVRAQPTHN